MQRSERDKVYFFNNLDIKYTLIENSFWVEEAFAYC